MTGNANVLVKVGGEQIEAVDKFTYLGREIDASGAIDLDIASRIKEDRSAFGIWSETEAIKSNVGSKGRSTIFFQSVS